MVESKANEVLQQDNQANFDHLDEEFGTEKEFQTYRMDLKDELFSGQLKICRFKIVFRHPSGQMKRRNGSGFLFDTKKVNGNLFGIILTCAHIFFKPDHDFSHSFVRFKLDDKKDIECITKQVFVSKEFQNLTKLQKSSLSRKEKVQRSLIDYAFVPIDITPELTRDNLEVNQKIFEIQKWNFGEGFCPLNKFEEEVNKFKNKERNLLAVCPLKYGQKITENSKCMSEIYLGYAINPILYYTPEIDNIEKFLMVYNIPIMKGHSGAVVGFSSEHQDKFFPIGIHLGNKVKGHTINYGRLITDEIIQLGKYVHQKIGTNPMQMGLQFFPEMGVYWSSQDGQKGLKDLEFSLKQPTTDRYE